MIILELDHASLAFMTIFFLMYRFLPLSAMQDLHLSSSPCLSCCAVMCHLCACGTAHKTEWRHCLHRAVLTSAAAQSAFPHPFLLFRACILSHFLRSRTSYTGLLLTLFQLLFFWKSLYFVFLFGMKFWAGIFGVCVYFSEKCINILHYLLPFIF